MSGSVWPADDPFDLLGGSSTAPAPTAPIQTSSTSSSTVELSATEEPVYAALFKAADTQGTGSVGPQRAVEFLSKSGLALDTLRVVWQLADTNQRGSLDRPAFYRALKLIAAAQSKLPVDANAISAATGLPQFEGIPTPAPTTGSNPLFTSQQSGSIFPQATGITRTGTVGSMFAPSSPSTPGVMSSAASVQNVHSAFKISEREREKYQAAFQLCKPVANVVQGEDARDLFMKSGLQVASLKKIWDLVDPKGSGTLNKTQFFVAMYIITRMKQGSLTTVPAQIPPQLFAALSENPVASPLVPSATGPQVTPSRGITRSSTVSGDHKMSNSFSSTMPDTSGISDVKSSQWAISSTEKAVYDKYFDTIDTEKSGQVTGEQAYNLFLKSGLSQTQLAKVWDLSDTTKAGKLNKEEFAVAMALIKLCSAGQTLPNELPYEFIPPSRRNSASHSKWPSSNIATKPTGSTPSKAAGDINLLGDPLDEVSWATSTPSVPATSTSGTTNAFNMSNIAPLQALSAQPTGSLAGNVSQTTRPGTGFPSVSDITVTREAMNLQEREKELEAKKQDLKSLQTSLNEVQPNYEELVKKRTELEKQLNKVRDDRTEVSLKLSQLKALYETESVIIQETNQSLARERQQLQTSLSEVQQAEAILATIASEKASLLSQLNKTRTDIDELQKQITQINEQCAPLRDEIDQHRGAILKLVQQREINEKVLASAQQEYNNFKMDIGTETRHLESERARATQLQQQIEVQRAITEKEEVSLAAARREKIALEENVKKSEEQLKLAMAGKVKADEEFTIVKAEIEELKKRQVAIASEISAANALAEKTRAEAKAATEEKARLAAEVESDEKRKTEATSAIESSGIPTEIPVAVATTSDIRSVSPTKSASPARSASPVKTESPVRTTSPTKSEVTATETPLNVEQDAVNTSSPTKEPVNLADSSAITDKSVAVTANENVSDKEQESSVAPEAAVNVSKSPLPKPANPFDADISTEKSPKFNSSVEFNSEGIPPTVDEFENLFSNANHTMQASSSNVGGEIVDLDKEFENAFEFVEEKPTNVEEAPVVQEMKKPIFGSLSTPTPAPTQTETTTNGVQTFGTQFSTTFDAFTTAPQNVAVAPNAQEVDDAFNVFNTQPAIVTTSSITPVAQVTSAEPTVPVTEVTNGTKLIAEAQLEAPASTNPQLVTSVASEANESSSPSPTSTAPPQSDAFSNADTHGSRSGLSGSFGILNGKKSKKEKKEKKEEKKDEKESGGKKMVSRLFGGNKVKKDKLNKNEQHFAESFMNNSAPQSPINGHPASTTGVVAEALEDPGALSAMFAGDPDSSEVKQLMALGFSKEKALDALERYGMDVTKATNYLLDQQ